jgi:hypothetical protein
MENVNDTLKCSFQRGGGAPEPTSQRFVTNAVESNLAEVEVSQRACFEGG